MNVSHLTRQAITHTLHCLLGCSIGEIGGMALGTIFHWHNLVMTLVSIALAFFFGYLLTATSLIRKGHPARRAITTAIATDTTSIASMELIDNVFVWLVPGALDATLSQSLFWFSLFASLIVAFILTVPVNRWLLARSGHWHH